jgi:hypothetical protein
MAVGARHRFPLEVAFRREKAAAKLLNDAFYAISGCQTKKLPWSDPGRHRSADPKPTHLATR